MWRTNGQSKASVLPFQNSSTIPNTSVENEITMKTGRGAYASNSAMQQEAQRRTYPLFPDFSYLHTVATHNTNSSPHLTIVDYGCGPASSSLTPLHHLLSTLPDGSSATLVLNDRTYNDWNDAAATIHQQLDSLQRGGKIQLFITLCPRSFYTQILPAASVDIGFSWSSFNYVEHQPRAVSASSFEELVQKRGERNRAQAHVDFVKLLRLRAVETKRGGVFIMALSAAPSEGAASSAWATIRESFRDAYTSGLLTEAQLAALDPGMHERCEEEVRCALEDPDVAPLWEVVHCEREVLVHPAWKALQGSEKTEEDYDAYGEAAARWIFAVLGWYVVRAVREGRCEAEKGPQREMTVEEEKLLEEIRKLAKKRFVSPELREVPPKGEFWSIKLIRT